MDRKNIIIVTSGINFQHIDTKSADCVVSIESTVIYGHSLPVVCNLTLSGSSENGISLTYQSETIFHNTFAPWMKNGEESYIIECACNKTIIECVADKISQTNNPVIYDLKI